MRATLLSLALLLAAAFVAGDAIACQQDSDCVEGTHCEIREGRVEGVCVNDVQQQPVERDTIETPPVDDDNDDGDGCDTSRDCGVGGRCVKQPGATTGTCAGGM